MTGFAAALWERIARDGPITVEAFMAAALAHYYGTRDPLGRGGDFTTAPEISQIFGELIALFLLQGWRDIGAPKPVHLVELGPGRGTLMSDIRRTLMKPGRDLLGAAQIHLVEASPALRERQEALLGPEIHWHASFDTIPRGPILLVANELFDALPIRQLVRTESGWMERCVGLDAEGGFAFVAGALTEQHVPRGLPLPLGEGTASSTGQGRGSILEVSPAREALAARVARRIARDGGTALIVDYGHATSAPGETLQAVKGHAYASPLAEPGEADLTAHVDFAALARAAQQEAVQVHGPVTQGAFLGALGIALRADALKRTAGAGTAAEIDAAVMRLTAPDQMGTLFKVMALNRIGGPALAGFP